MPLFCQKIAISIKNNSILLKKIRLFRFIVDIFLRLSVLWHIVICCDDELTVYFTCTWQEDHFLCERGSRIVVFVVLCKLSLMGILLWDGWILRNKSLLCDLCVSISLSSEPDEHARWGYWVESREKCDKLGCFKVWWMRQRTIRVLYRSYWAMIVKIE